jgi:hypothetical protein
MAQQLMQPPPSQVQISTPAGLHTVASMFDQNKTTTSSTSANKHLTLTARSGKLKDRL